ncbi:MAG: cytochrome c [Xanthomonadales bacterium]|nr:cytochrome c [Xanthomonadales bacterium]
MIRVITIVLLSLLALGGAGVGTVYLLSESQLRDVPQALAFDLPIPTDAAAIERGRHLARTRGCFGCHGQELEGRVFSSEWDWVDRAVAPNLALHARQHSSQVLERAIRQGVGHDGRALWSMPSYNWVHLSDSDTADLIAFLQNAPVVEKDLPSPRLGLGIRLSMVLGRDTHMADWAADVPPLQLRSDAEESLRRGEYLAMTTCNECHGFDLRGATNGGAMPDLAILGAYSDDSFRTLMQLGVGLGGRDDLNLMSMVAKDRFAYFTDQELEDLLAFLRTLPGKPIPQGVWWRQ